tara:strand:+ start:1394 stop:2485 length:1092 start_codon:yes stop_codon:yes gene_type:complete
MAYTNIDDPSAHFQTALYTGNGSSQNITNDGNSDLQPDLLWTKERTNSSTDNVLANSSIGWDAPKGVGYPWENGPFGGQMSTNSTGAESTPAATYGYASAALTDGFTVSAGGTNADNCNKNNAEFVAWQWKANGGTKSTNSDGSTDATVQVNQDAGFSIVGFTTDGGNETYGHGLGVKPDIVIVKSRSGGGSWIYMTDVIDGSVDYLLLNGTNAAADLSYGAFTSSTFQYNDNNAVTQIAYCFASKQGYSKFGSYVGNGNANGPFIYTGFKPAFVMQKRTDSTGAWHMFDSKRNLFNEVDNYLYANTSEAEYDGSNDGLDFLSNGFKISNTYTGLNASGGTYIYMAFAENPFTTSTGIPTTAR